MENLKKRDSVIDIAKGILIILMLIGHNSLCQGPLRLFIYSFHMVGFVLFSGYFFKKGTLTKQWGGAVKGLLRPYLCFSLFVIGWMLLFFGRDAAFRQFLCQLAGMSFWANIFTDVGSVGAIYFVLILFGAKVLYALLQKICRGKVFVTTIMVLLLSLAGVWLGKHGWWLPWSFDLALYVLVFYHIGYLLKKYEIFSRMKKHLYVLIPLILLWGYQISSGSMEIFFRDYEPYLLVVLGAAAGNVALYWFSYVLHKCRYIAVPLCFAGRQTFWILMAHTFMQMYVIGRMQDIPAVHTLWFGAASIVFDLVSGCLLGFLLQKRKMFVAKTQNVLQTDGGSHDVEGDLAVHQTGGSLKQHVK